MTATVSLLSPTQMQYHVRYPCRNANRTWIQPSAARALGDTEVK
jgi:hypothetical protein